VIRIRNEFQPDPGFGMKSSRIPNTVFSLRFSKLMGQAAKNNFHIYRYLHAHLIPRSICWKRGCSTSQPQGIQHIGLDLRARGGGWPVRPVLTLPERTLKEKTEPTSGGIRTCARIFHKQGEKHKFKVTVQTEKPEVKFIAIR
jgi:hypothetical protein